MIAMREAGIKRFNGDGRSAHALRHTCAHDLLEQTQNVYAVQLALRHRSITSTQIYLRGSVRDLRATMGGRRYGAAMGETA
jgi:site-specific recombinase XerD